VTALDLPHAAHWPSPVRAVGGDVSESRSSIKVPEGALRFTLRSMRGSSRCWVMADNGHVLVGSSLVDAMRKLASYYGYSANDVAAALAL
jgi:hypothetical protein